MFFFLLKWFYVTPYMKVDGASKKCQIVAAKQPVITTTIFIAHARFSQTVQSGPRLSGKLC